MSVSSRSSTSVFCLWKGVFRAGGVHEPDAETEGACSVADCDVVARVSGGFKCTMGSDAVREPGIEWRWGALCKLIFGTGGGASSSVPSESLSAMVLPPMELSSSVPSLERFSGVSANGAPERDVHAMQRQRQTRRHIRMRNMRRISASNGVGAGAFVEVDASSEAGGVVE